jgi:hypothetical protein
MKQVIVKKLYWRDTGTIESLIGTWKWRLLGYLALITTTPFFYYGYKPCLNTQDLAQSVEEVSFVDLTKY